MDKIIAAGVLLVFLCVAVLIYSVYNKKKKKKAQENQTQ